MPDISNLSNSEIASEYKSSGGDCDPGLVKLLLDLRDQVVEVVGDRGSDAKFVAEVYTNLADHFITCMSGLGVGSQEDKAANQRALENTLYILLVGIMRGYCTLSVHLGTSNLAAIESIHKKASATMILELFHKVVGGKI